MTNIKIKVAKTKLVRKIVEKRGHINNNNEKCVYCGKCSTVCPVKAITVDRASKKWTIDNNICVRCQKCVKNCPTNALSLQKQEYIK